MQVGDLGEFQLIERITKLVGPRPGAAATLSPSVGFQPELLLAIGDDAAVWRLGRTLEIVTTDTLVDGVHFLRKSADPRLLGWKALAVNTSDINAMGAAPAFALITLGLPRDTEISWVDDLYVGLMEHAVAAGVTIVGGDIVRSPVLFVTIAVSGTTRSRRDWRRGLLLRSAAKPGDVIGVSNSIGGSAGGLTILLNQRDAAEPFRSELLTAHHRPNPPLGLGARLAELGVRCGLDLSDGLAGDLGQICRASTVGAEARLAALPIHPALAAAWPADAARIAAAGGEDYEIVFTASPAVWRRVQQAALPVTAIGRITAGPPMVRFVDGDEEIVSWDHLREQP